MLKNSSYKEKFARLKPWMNTILESIKKDVKNEHLRNDRLFCNRHFAGKHLNKISSEELAAAYDLAIACEEKAEELGEFLTNRWLLKHSDIYQHFDQELSQINKNFDELELLEKNSSMHMMEKAVEQFGAPKTYLFCVLNSVVFPEEVFKILSDKADMESEQQHCEEQAFQEQNSKEEMQRTHATQISRLTDKYEKKLQGMQKKYVQDIETLKKQLSALQRKLTVHE